MTFHDCCFYKCDRHGTIFIGKNGDPETEWICEHDRDKWNADRNRFIADGGGCEMQKLGELLEPSTGRCRNRLCEADVP
jgi:hypothetical protein